MSEKPRRLGALELLETVLDEGSWKSWDTTPVQPRPAGVQDPEYLVRHQAATALLRWSGDRRPLDAVPGLLAGITDASEIAWLAAADELASRFRRQAN